MSGGELRGRIIKSTGGFYYIDCEGDVIRTRARGLFRNEQVTPYVGDWVVAKDAGDGTGYIVSVLPRVNSLVRPPLANIDQLVIVASVEDPAPNLYVIDKVIAVAEYKDITPVVVFTKTDLADVSKYRGIYIGAGFCVYCVSCVDKGGLSQVGDMLRGKTSALSGNSGVGKSSLLNALEPGFSLQTGTTSKKLGRGRHTTRHVELYKMNNGGYVADTPGFSDVDTTRLETIHKEQLHFCFREFTPFTGNCRYTGCSHTVEKGCAVLAAVTCGDIAPSRHQSYAALYAEIKKSTDW